MRSCSLPVLMHETTEQVASVDPGRLILAGKGLSDGWIGRLQPERPVRTVGVVVLDIDVDLLEVAAADDQQPVQALGPDRARPALGVGVRRGCPHRRAEHLTTLRAEHLVETAAELGVPVVDKEAHLAAPLAQHQQKVAGLLVTQRPSGLAVTPVRCTRRLSSSMKNSTYNRRSHTVSTVKKSQATIPAACWRRNARQVMAARRGAGSSPWRRRVVQITVAETRTPRCSSSPWMRW